MSVRTRKCAILLALLVLAASSGRGAAQEAASMPADNPTPEGSAPADGTGAEAEVETIVRGILAGTHDPLEYIDPAHGLLWLEYLEGDPDGPERQTAERLCGSDLAAAGERIRAWFAGMREQALDLDLECDPDRCKAPGMEWVPALYAVFTRDASGRLWLNSLQSRSEALLGDEWFDAMEAWIAQRMTEFRGTSCP